MRALVIGMYAAGAACIGYGIYAGIRAAGDDDSITQMSNSIWAVSGLIFGAVFVLAATRLKQAVPTRVRAANSIAGYGTVTSTRDTGITVNNTQLVLEADITALAPGIDPYPASVSLRLGRTQWAAIQPGMQIPILIDRADHTKVAFDHSRAAISGVGGVPGTQVVTRRAADIISVGVPVMGTLFSAAPAGATAGQFSSILPPDQADDPLVSVSFGYPGPGGQALTMNAIVRVPDGKQLVAGTPVPVRYLRDNPSTATIDWPRL